MRWAINGRPQGTARLNGIDHDGLMYVGKAKNLKQRIKLLRLGIIEGAKTRSVSYRHTAAYTFTFYGFAEKIKPEQLEVRWAVLSEQESDGWEQILLHDYCGKYLDKPPLNTSSRRM